MKKNVFSIILPVILLLCACQSDDTVKNSELMLLSESVEVASEGGAYEILYKIGNRRDDELPSATTEAEWISGIDCSEYGRIRFVVDSNEAAPERNNVVTLSFEGVQYDVTVSQAAGFTVENQCDLFVQAAYYGDSFYDNENYYLNLGDKPVDEVGRYDVNGSYYRLNLFGPKAESLERVILPEGTYVYDSDNTFADWTFSAEYSSALYKGQELAFKQATLDVVYEGDLCRMTLVAVFKDGSSHSAVYQGEGVFQDYSLRWIEADIDIQAIDGFSAYVEEMESAVYKANMNMRFIDSELNNGHLVPPGNILVLVGNIPMGMGGKILPGTWEISETVKDTGTLFPGRCERFFGPFAGWTVVQSYDASGNISYGLITSGTVTISEAGNDEYTFDIEMKTRNGKRITCHYTGPMIVDGYPQPADDKKLPMDYEVQLPTERITAVASTLYDGYDEIKWTIDLREVNSHYQFVNDQLKLEITCAGPSAADGPTPGVYTVGKGVGTVTAGTFRPTFQVMSFYVGRDENSQIFQGAAVAGGDLKLDKNEDGTYTIEFDFLDDQVEPKRFYGSWTGELDITIF